EAAPPPLSAPPAPTAADDRKDQTAVAPIERGSGSIPVISWALWGGGALAGGAFAYFAISGRSQESDLSRTCAGHCAPEDVAAVHRKYVAADVSWVTAAVALGTGSAIALWPLLFPEAPVSASIGPRGAAVEVRF